MKIIFVMKIYQNQHIKFGFTLLFLCFATLLNAQNYNNYSGQLLDAKTKTPLHLATLNIKDSNISTVTNNEGEFTIKTPIKTKFNTLIVSYLGYETTLIKLKDLKVKGNTILLKPSTTLLETIAINRPKNAKDLVLKALSLKDENYITENSVMTGFYRETIKKRNKNASLSEAVLKIKKAPYNSARQDQISIVKARKNVDYTKLDTLAFKLQGGPFSALHTDVIKYPEFIFSADNINDYDFKFMAPTEINNSLVYVVNFKQKADVRDLLYYGQLYIDANTNALTRATYQLNLEDKKKASKLFVKRKPNGAKVLPTKANYLVNYNSKNGKWHYAYSNINLEFKVKWKSNWFSKNYSLNSEMAITNWEFNNTFKVAKNNKLKANSILQEKASGFSDPNFWGQYNIIEPEKSIETAIKKISKQLKKV